jgi:hypothetical protein
MLLFPDESVYTNRKMRFMIRMKLGARLGLHSK